MKYIIERHKKIWNDRHFIASVAMGVVLLILSLVINYYALSYAADSASMPVTDIILSNIRVFDVDGIIITVSLILFAVSIWQGINHPKNIPFVLKTGALFIVIRSIFISLTHLGAFTPHLMIDSSRLMTVLGLGSADDLFFSGHTGLPFLAALVFWDDRIPRYILLSGSIILATCMLLSHLHYSIDVLAAFFITYTIFHIAQKLFADDWKLVNKDFI